MPFIHQPHPDAEYNLPEIADARQIIGNRVRTLREKFRMSQVELARNLGKESATYIALIEQGKRNISSGELARLARHLKVKLSYFYP